MRESSRALIAASVVSTFCVAAAMRSLRAIAPLTSIPLLSQVGPLTDLYAAAGIEGVLRVWLCVPIAFPVLGLAIQAVNGLTWIARELAHLLLASPDAARLPWTARSTAR